MPNSELPEVVAPLFVPKMQGVSFKLPGKILFGDGVASSAESYSDLTREGVKRILMVVDPGVRKSAPWFADVERAIGDQFDTDVFDGVSPNPRVSEAQEIGLQARQNGFSAIAGVGGGSAMDAARAGAMLAANPGKIEDFLGGPGKYKRPPLPLVQVPSTCGTGSEVTWVSVLSPGNGQPKISVKGMEMLARTAIVDPDTLKTLPPELVAYTGMDALTHALEAFTCTGASDMTDPNAASAIHKLLYNLPDAVSDIALNHIARREVMMASMLAGTAFGNSDVAGVHCLSEAIGGMYDQPHGLLNAMLLVPVMRYHFEHIKTRLALLEARVTGASEEEARRDMDGNAEQFMKRLEELAATLAIPSFTSLGISKADITKIAKAAEANGSNGSNPQTMAAADYERILEKLY